MVSATLEERVLKRLGSLRRERPVLQRIAPAPGESALAPLLAPTASAPHHPPGRRAAGSGAGCLAPGQPHAPGHRTSSSSGSAPATCVPVLQGRSGPQSPRPLRPAGGDHSLPSSTLICSHCQPAPPNSLVPRSFAFISVKTDFAVGYSLEVPNRNCLEFLNSFWDKCCCQSNSGPKSWALEFME